MMQPSVSYLDNSKMPIIDAANTLLQEKNAWATCANTYIFIYITVTIMPYQILYKMTSYNYIQTTYVYCVCVWQKYENK